MPSEPGAMTQRPCWIRQTRIANSRIEIIKDCGHVPQVERLEVLKPLVARFLDQGSPAAMAAPIVG
jgi:hypothetical protein